MTEEKQKPLLNIEIDLPKLNLEIDIPRIEIPKLDLEIDLEASSKRFRNGVKLE